MCVCVCVCTSGSVYVCVLACARDRLACVCVCVCVRARARAYACTRACWFKVNHSPLRLRSTRYIFNRLSAHIPCLSALHDSTLRLAVFIRRSVRTTSPIFHHCPPLHTEHRPRSRVIFIFHRMQLPDDVFITLLSLRLFCGGPGKPRTQKCT